MAVIGKLKQTQIVEEKQEEIERSRCRGAGIGSKSGREDGEAGKGAGMYSEAQ